jgi:hypothetical protein
VGCRAGRGHLAVDLDAMQVPWCWHAYQHGLYRNPDCHYHYCIEIEHILQVHLDAKPQVTCLHDGYSRRSETQMQIFNVVIQGESGKLMVQPSRLVSASVVFVPEPEVQVF